VQTTVVCAPRLSTTLPVNVSDPVVAVPVIVPSALSVMPEGREPAEMEKV
jgi:hypothetical protein